MHVTSNKLLAYFESFDRRILFICRMINTITIHNLSQENVSCLNTTRVVLLLANKRGLLPKYLKAIRDKSNEMAVDRLAPSSSSTSTINDQVNRPGGGATSQQPANPPPGQIDLMHNFRDLLMFTSSDMVCYNK